MRERKVFYIQASCLCLEAISLRDSEQPAENITNYQVSLSQTDHLIRIGTICVAHTFLFGRWHGGTTICRQLHCKGPFYT